MKFVSSIEVGLAVAGMFFAVTGPAMAQNDAHFASEAAQGGRFEVAAGKLAVEKGSSAEVKQFGQRMIDDHTKVGNELMGIAAKNSLNLPDGMSAKDRATMNRLSKLSGLAFDRAYIGDMVLDHQADIAAFQHEANDGTNADLKNFASNTLPTLQDHLRQAKAARSEVGAVSSNRFNRK